MKNYSKRFLHSVILLFLQLIVIDAAYSQTGTIRGRLLDDQNSNCILNVGEVGLGQIVMTARNPQNFSYHTLTDSNGSYRFDLPADTYNVSPAIAYDTLYFGVCGNAFPSITLQNGQTDTVDILLRHSVQAPLIRAEITTSRLEPCQSGLLTVAMQNVGTDSFINFSATLVLDPNLSYSGFISTPTALSVTVLSNDSLRLNFTNNNAIGYQLQKPLLYTLGVNVACNNSRTGLFYNKLFIDNQILARSPAWNDAILNVSTQCETDTVRFELKNTGSSNQNPIDYYIVEDNVMLRQGTVNLQNGQSTTVSVPSTPARSYRLEARNPANIPAVLADSFAYAMTERCDTFVGLNTFMNWYATNDVSPFRDYAATEATPNSADFFIATTPKGYDTAHYVNQGSWIEYVVEFRNTQGGTVSDVDLIDTLPQELDISTLQIGASSHNLNLNLNNNILNAHIFNAGLTDSAANYLNSLGFISYRLRLKDNLPNGTVVRNRAHLLYDANFAYYHLPEVFHTIGQNYIRVLSTHRSLAQDPKVTVYPNPFVSQTTFQTTGKPSDLSILVFNGLGQLVKSTQQAQTNTLTIYRDNLPTGVYYYQLLSDTQLIDAGKIVVE